jgi:5,10-methylenetetrahydromethanopterin reductase
MEFGAGIFGGFAPDRFRGLVRAIEESGFSSLWVADEGLHRDPYTLLASAVAVTSRITLGTGVTNPYTRHPALTAASIATVDELSAGRAVLGLGGGGSAPLALVLTKPRPAVAVKDAAAIINALTATGRADHDGRAISFHGTLDFTPPRRVPIFIAATGSAMLQLAGEVGDGVIIGDAATPRGIRAGLDHVSVGAARRHREIPPAVCWWATAVSEDRERARQAVSRIVAVSIMNHRHRLEELGLHLSTEMRGVLEAHGWTRTHASVEALAGVLTPEAVDALSLAGPAGECAERIRAIAEVGAVRQAGILLRPPQGSTFEEQLRLFAERVMPHV